MSCTLSGILICDIDGKKRSFRKIPVNNMLDGKYEYQLLDAKNGITYPGQTADLQKIKKDSNIKYIYVSNGDEKWLVLGGGGRSVSNIKVYDTTFSKIVKFQSEPYWNGKVGKGNWEAVNGETGGPILAYNLDTNTSDITRTSALHKYKSINFDAVACNIDNVFGLDCIPDAHYDFIIFDSHTIYLATITSMILDTLKKKLKPYGQLFLEFNSYQPNVYAEFIAEMQTIVITSQIGASDAFPKSLQKLETKFKTIYANISNFISSHIEIKMTPEIYTGVKKYYPTYDIEYRIMIDKINAQVHNKNDILLKNTFRNVVTETNDILPRIHKDTPRTFFVCSDFKNYVF